MNRRRIFGREGPARYSRDAAVVAIDCLRRDQALIDARLRESIVDAAVLHRAVRDQRCLLEDAAARLRDAADGARAAADTAAADGGDAAALPYRQAVEAFTAQQGALRTVRAQLDAVAGGAAANLGRTRALLRESSASLDRALRAEVDLLGRLERIDRARVVAESVRRARPPADRP